VRNAGIHVAVRNVGARCLADGPAAFAVGGVELGGAEAFDGGAEILRERGRGWPGEKRGRRDWLRRGGTCRWGSAGRRRRGQVGRRCSLHRKVHRGSEPDKADFGANENGPRRTLVRSERGALRSERA